jgi:hypothetical protein
MSSSSLSHCVTTQVDVPASFAFAFLTDLTRLGHWALGCMRTRPTDEPGVYTGYSLFDSSQSWVSIDADPDLCLIDYKVGPKGALVHRISARVISGANAGLSAGQCLVMLMAWRPAGMEDSRWRRLCASHEAEILLIREQIIRFNEAAGISPGESPDFT